MYFIKRLPENSTQENSTQENSTQENSTHENLTQKTQHKKTQHKKTQHKKTQHKKTQHKKIQHIKLNTRKLNTRKLNTENSTHFKHLIIVIYIMHLYSLFVRLIIYAFFLRYSCLRLNFFYRFVSWFGPMLTMFQREKQIPADGLTQHDILTHAFTVFSTSKCHFRT